MATEVAVDALDEEWKNYVVLVSGGKENFSKKYGCLDPWPSLPSTEKGHSCYR
jgi:hypothetical protein